MKYIKELETDFIGGLGPLTKEDEKAISDCIQAVKRSRLKRKAVASLLKRDLHVRT